jgi:hypothetical protein
VGKWAADSCHANKAEWPPWHDTTTPPSLLPTSHRFRQRRRLWRRCCSLTTINSNLAVATEELSVSRRPPPAEVTNSSCESQIVVSPSCMDLPSLQTLQTHIPRSTLGCAPTRTRSHYPGHQLSAPQTLALRIDAPVCSRQPALQLSQTSTALPHIMSNLCETRQATRGGSRYPHECALFSILHFGSQIKPTGKNAAVASSRRRAFANNTSNDPACGLPSCKHTTWLLCPTLASFPAVPLATLQDFVPTSPTLGTALQLHSYTCKSGRYMRNNALVTRIAPRARL